MKMFKKRFEVTNINIFEVQLLNTAKLKHSKMCFTAFNIKQLRLEKYGHGVKFTV